MVVASVIVSGVLAAVVAVAALRKLSHRDAVVESYARAGVPEPWLNRLAVLLLLASAGLVIGTWWAPVGVAASAGLLAYFLIAVVFHVRAKDVAQVMTPSVLVVLAAAALILRIGAR
jgi:DoxX-like family